MVRRCTLLAAMMLTLMAGCRREEPARTPDAPEAPTSAQVKTELHYTLVRTLDSGLERLSGVAVDSSDRVYLVGTGGVRVTNAQGNLISSWPTCGPAKCAAVDADNRAYVALQNKIEKYDKDGKLLASWGTGANGSIALQIVSGIAVFGPNVYVADAGARCIERYDVTGDFIDDIGRRRAGSDGMVCPSPFLDCAVDENGFLYVNNPGLCRVEKYDQNGERVGMWGNPGDKPEDFSGCCNPSNIALLPSGRVVTAEKVTPRVKVYDAKGVMLAYIGPEYFSKMAEGLDLAVNSKGDIYVVDPGANKLLVFSPVKP